MIALFNGFIPLVAIQMHAMCCGDQISLVCTKVLDQMALGLEEEDGEPEVVDRSYWEKRATKDTVQLADKLLELIHTFAPSVELKYNKFYIGLAQDGHTNNFTTFQPQKNAIRLELRMSKSDDVQKQISEKGLDLTDYTTWGTYRIRLSKADVKEQSQFLMDLMKQAYEEGKK